ncbi:MAG: DUF1573 domain-containing protein [Calditrichaeota bacterium]|nr:MAG: DUF1573 domain-containing protein [Calditrichota bacterium]
MQIIANVVTRPDSTYPLIMQPYKLDLSQYGEKVRDRIEFEIKNVSDTKIDLTTISYATDFFDIEIPASIGPNETGKGVVILKSEVLKQNFEKSFTIECNDEKTSRFTVPVKRSVRSSSSPTSSTKGH